MIARQELGVRVGTSRQTTLAHGDRTLAADRRVGRCAALITITE